MSEDLITPSSEVILPAKSEDKLEIEKEELLLERLKEADSRDHLDYSPDGNKTEDSLDYRECIVSNEEISKKKFKMPNVVVPPIKTPKVPGFLKPKKDDSPTSGEEAPNEASRRLPKLPAFLKRKKPGEDGEPGEDEADDNEEDEKKNFLDNVRARFNKNKEDPEAEDSRASMKPAARAVLESLRSAAHQVPQYFKGKKPEDSKKDPEAGEVGDPEESKELLDEKNKATPEDDLEEIKIGEEDDKKPPSRIKEVSRQCSEEFKGLDTKQKIAILLILLGILLLILIISLAAGTSPSGWTNDIRFIHGGKHVEAHTTCGTVIGLVEAPDQLRFTGIPYAANTSQRFTQSRIPSNLEECFSPDFIAYEDDPSRCMTRKRDGTIEGEEDCLSLNIYTTSVVYEEFMPVVVYIAGDDVNTTIGPSTELSKEKGVVFVEVNYRLGSLGFLSNDVLSRRSYPHTSGNYGLGDIITALKWIQLNIQHFGGHPKKVTLLGSGFGASLVTALTSSRHAKSLYNGIWATNGAGSFANLTLEAVSQESEQIVKPLNCGSDVERCLVNADAEVLTENIPAEWATSKTNSLPIMGEKDHSWIVVDKHILSHHPVSYWRTHPQELSVPMVFGVTEHVEATEENIGLMDWEDRDLFEALVEEKLGSFNVTLPGLALGHYNSTDNWIDYISLLSDIRTLCPILNLAQEASVNSNTNVYSYIASQRRPNELGIIAEPESDISAIFGVYEPTNSTETRFVTNMQELFYSFVKEGVFPYGDRDVALGYYKVDSKVSFRHEPRETCKFWENANHIVPEYANLD
eukprot:TRINITY_DN1488_c0_g1_i4.p1 TRINITY_DN1488_c0_g1~~TRINITY_DN1488_c0_g1_i4.p1  ORF type:complete len:803 (-),score=252.21 TRINITY_DN1488_c0_g1_i4:2011-4419(-)